jgi:hypothetical protein
MELKLIGKDLEKLLMKYNDKDVNNPIKLLTRLEELEFKFEYRYKTDKNKIEMKLEYPLVNFNIIFKNIFEDYSLEIEIHFNSYDDLEGVDHFWKICFQNIYYYLRKIIIKYELNIIKPGTLILWNYDKSRGQSMRQDLDNLYKKIIMELKVKNKGVNFIIGDDHNE